MKFKGMLMLKNKDQQGRLVHILKDASMYCLGKMTRKLGGIDNRSTIMHFSPKRTKNFLTDNDNEKNYRDDID